MPYIVVKRNGKYLVYKKDEDGNPTGKALGKHDTLKMARKQQKALYANEAKEMLNWKLLTEQSGENKGYVYLSVYSGWEINRMRDALNIVFSGEENWNWVDPYTLHITLAYCESVTDEQLLTGLNGALGKPAMELIVSGISTFDNPETGEKVVYLGVEKSEALVELQRSVYEALNVEGVVLSEYSNPENWIPHITLAYAPLESAVPEISSQIYIYTNEVCAARSEYEKVATIHLRWQDSVMGSEDGVGPTMEHAVWKIVAPETEPTQEVAAEMETQREAIRLTFISEFRGNPPKIDLPPDISIEEIKKEWKRKFNEDEPDFWTLPIGQVGAKSRNGRTYPQTPVEELVEQVNELRPEGMWGHLSDEELATRYDPPAIRWIAAKIDKEGIAWGKLLPLTKEARDYYRDARATKSKTATSLTAMAEMKGNVVQHIELNTIDIADPRRVGILATVAMPVLTQEMNDRSGVNAVSLGNNHDVIIRVRETQTVNEEKAMLTEQEINELTSERDTLKTQLTELQGKLEEANEKLAAGATREEGYLKSIGELLQEFIVSEVREQVALEHARDIVIEQVISLQPQSRDAVKESIQKILSKESMKKLLKMEVAREMGDPQRPAQNGNLPEPTPEEKYLDPEPKITIPSREA